MVGFMQTNQITPSAVARYDQAPWRKAHILALYTIEPTALRDDGMWHRLPSVVGEVAFYRVYSQQYFQFVAAPTYNTLVEALLHMPPVQTEDDAEWWIWQVDRRGFDGLWLTSIFPITPGPFAYQAEVDRWLRGYGLALIPQDGYVRGFARLEAITPEHLKVAMERLVWLENAVLDLNRRIVRVGQRFWRKVQQASVAGEGDGSMRLAAKYQRKGRKFRKPI